MLRASALRPPVSASTRFQRHRHRLAGAAPATVFTFIYDHNVWGSAESRSGEGSELDATRVLRERIPRLLRRYAVRTMLDAPCGDFGWMRHVDLGGVAYTGLDIVPRVVRDNQERFGSPGRQFVVGDLIADPLPPADLVLCRDCLVHLTYAQIFAALANIASSGAAYLLTTTFTEIDENADAVTGDWRALNLCAPPFNLPPPLEVIVEGCTEVGGAFADKSLGLWSTDMLPRG